MTKSIQYCTIHKLPQEVAPILDNLRAEHWPLFVQAKKEEGKLILTTGYYSGLCRFSHKVILTGIIVKACLKAGIKYWYNNVSPRRGAKGERITIYYLKSRDTYFTNL